MGHFYIEINGKDLQETELFLKIIYLNNSMTPMVKFFLKEVKTTQPATLLKTKFTIRY